MHTDYARLFIQYTIAELNSANHVCTPTMHIHLTNTHTDADQNSARYVCTLLIM